MPVQEVHSIWSLVDKGGTLALSLLFIVAFVRGWVVPRWSYDALKDHCKDILALAERNAELATRVSGAMEKKTERGG